MRRVHFSILPPEARRKMASVRTGDGNDVVGPKVVGKGVCIERGTHQDDLNVWRR